MTVPLVHGSKAVASLPGSRAAAGSRGRLDDRSAMTTVGVAALLIMVWMGVLIGFYFSLARHF